MSYTAMPQTQRGVIARLRACDELTALLKGGIHDALPNKAAMPYLVYESAVETPNDYFGQGGHFTDVTIQIFTNDGSLTKSGRGTAGFITGTEIAEIVMRELLSLDTPLAVDGHDVAELALIGINVIRSDDGADTRVTEVAFTAELEDDLGA